MGKSMFFGAVCLWATVLLAGGKVTPLNVTTGLWETTSTTMINGSIGLPPELIARMTPEQRAKFEAAMKRRANGTPTTRTYKSCLTKKQLNEDPFTDKDHGKMKCQENVINSTGSDLEVKESCAEEGGKGDVHISYHAFDSEHVTGNGEVTMTMNGHTMNSKLKYESKWLGATCPAGVN